MALTTYYLEMAAPPAYVTDAMSAEAQANRFVLQECVRPQFEYNRFLYQLVGAAFDWTERLVWSDEQWQTLVSDSKLRTWVAYVEGAVAGYFELHRVNDDVEILYFGLSGDFIGQGLGRLFLESAVRQAWDWQGAQRVWVHTCNYDHPSALKNYQQRGFELYDTTVEDD
jgi:GNAT superfamily N-acetyltransferase